MSLKIKQGAVFISDAHHSPKNKNLDNFLKAIENEQITPTQIFWMGDIFDLLVGGITPTLKENEAIIKRINALDIQQYYFEGNHDFNLQKVFPKITVFPRKVHPVIAECEGKKIALSHGDIFTPFGYNFYITVITNRFVLAFLSLLNYKMWITDKINAYNNAKNLCKRVKNFDKIVDMRLQKYRGFAVDMVVEGHFHQNFFMQKDEENISYLNLPAFVCSQSFFIVKSDYERLFIEQELRSNDG